MSSAARSIAALFFPVWVFCVLPRLCACISAGQQAVSDLQDIHQQAQALEPQQQQHTYGELVQQKQEVAQFLDMLDHIQEEQAQDEQQLQLEKQQRLQRERQNQQVQLQQQQHGTMMRSMAIRANLTAPFYAIEPNDGSMCLEGMKADVQDTIPQFVTSAWDHWEHDPVIMHGDCASAGFSFGCAPVFGCAWRWSGEGCSVQQCFSDRKGRALHAQRILHKHPERAPLALPLFAFDTVANLFR